MSAEFYVRLAATAVVAFGAVGFFRWALFDDLGKPHPVAALLGKSAAAWVLNVVALVAIVALFAAATGLIWSIGQ